MTETVTHCITGKPIERLPDRSMGHVTPGYEIAVVDKDTRQLCAEGDTASWGARHPWHPAVPRVRPEPRSQRERLRGRLVQDRRHGAHGAGRQRLYVERDKDLLKVGGENVSAKEVEDLVVSHPAVQQAAVVGKQHDFLGEVPVVFVIAAPGEHDESAVSDEIIKLCKDSLATFKVPCPSTTSSPSRPARSTSCSRTSPRAGRRATAGVLTPNLTRRSS